MDAFAGRPMWLTFLFNNASLRTVAAATTSYQGNDDATLNAFNETKPMDAARQRSGKQIRCDATKRV